MTKENREKMVERFGRDLVRYDEKAVKWGAEFAEDPMYALEWSKTTFECVARAHVAARVRRMLLEKNEEGEYCYSHFGDIQDRAKEEALRGARNRKFSTSPTSNLLTQFVTAAWAEAVERLDGRL